MDNLKQILKAEALEDIIRPGTKRGLDFVIIEELRKRTGIMPDEVLKFAMAEMLCNALDTDATVINISVHACKKGGLCALHH